MGRPEDLRRETERWVADGVISPEQRQAILDRYPDKEPGKEEDEQLSARTLVWLAWLVAGFGFVLLVAWNWTLFASGYKVGGATVVALVLYGASWYSDRHEADRRAELLAFAGALATGAAIVATTELLALPRTNTWPVLFWAMAIALTALVAASPIVTTFGAAVLLFWGLTDTGSPPAPWAFMLVFPVLAVAAERRSRQYSAGAVSLALGVWIVLVGLDTWRSPFTPGVMAIVAGSVIDRWAHLPADRRPAFAHVIPALALAGLGLAFLGGAALQGAAPPTLWGELGLVLPGAVLVVALTTLALWPAGAQPEPRWRPQVLGGLVVLWIATVLAAGGQEVVPTWWTWTWTLLPSIALVALTISAVREGVRARNLGLFAVGVLAMVALVVMHFSGETNRAGRSAVVLFAAAGVLWWVSRTLRPAK